MSTVEEAFRQVVGAVVVQPPLRFTWLGEPSPQVPRRMRLRLTTAQAREHLLGTLQLRLYRDFYSAGGRVILRPDPESPRAAPDFVDGLSAANTGRGHWQEGWKITGAHAEGVIAMRDGLSAIVSAARLRPAQTPLVRGSAVAVHSPKELPARLPGFYIATGDADFDPATQVVVRLYWNVSASGARRLVRFVTWMLNSEGLRFWLKLVDAPNRYDRCDPAVLYMACDDWAAMASTLGPIYEAVATTLRPGTPAFTKSLAPGLGLAEDPGTGESFGMHRSRVLADALILAREARVRSAAARVGSITQRFLEESIDLDRPYLNPGSEDRYGWEPLRSGARLTCRRTPRPESPGEHVRVAEKIATQLCSRALWHEGRCTWIGADPHMSGTTSVPVRPKVSTLGPTVYSGTAGVAIFLAEMAAAGHRDARGTALGAMNHALLHVDRLGPGRSLGLYTGALGVAVGAARVGLVLQASQLTAAGNRLARHCVAARNKCRERDLMGGDAGAIVGLLALAEITGDHVFVDDAMTIARELIAAGRRDDDAISWPSGEMGDGTALTGFSHGAAGIAWALLQLYRRTDRTELREVADAAVRFERRWFSPVAQNWRDRRGLPGTGPFMTAWCHGAPGITLSRLETRGSDDSLRDREVEVGLARTKESVKEALGERIDDFSLCHGLSGNADVLLEVGRRTGDGPARRLAAAVGRLGTETFARNGRWPCGTGGGQTPGLMLGTAGIGMFYLRLADPIVPSPLLPDPSVFAASPSSQTMVAQQAPPANRGTTGIAKHVGVLDEEALRGLVRLGLRAEGFTPSHSEIARAEAQRWEIGVELRDRTLPARLPRFAELSSYLALPDVDPRLWDSLPFMLAFGFEQARVLAPLARAEPVASEELCAWFSALLSVFDYVVDETAHGDTLFRIERAAVAGLFDTHGADDVLAAAVARTPDPRVHLTCALFAILREGFSELLDACPARAWRDLAQHMRRLFAAERESTLAHAPSLTELRRLAAASQAKSVLPFVTLLRIIALKAPVPLPEEAGAASEALGRAICRADDLVDILADLERGAPSPVVLDICERIAVHGRSFVADLDLVDAAERHSRALALSLLPESFGVAGAGGASAEVIAFAARSVARWVGWRTDVLAPNATGLVPDALGLTRRAFGPAGIDTETRASLGRCLQVLGEHGLAGAVGRSARTNTWCSADARLRRPATGGLAP